MKSIWQSPRRESGAQIGHNQFYYKDMLSLLHTVKKTKQNSSSGAEILLLQILSPIPDEFLL